MSNGEPGPLACLAGVVFEDPQKSAEAVLLRVMLMHLRRGRAMPDRKDARAHAPTLGSDEPRHQAQRPEPAPDSALARQAPRDEAQENGRTGRSQAPAADGSAAPHRPGRRAQDNQAEESDRVDQRVPIPGGRLLRTPERRPARRGAGIMPRRTTSPRSLVSPSAAEPVLDSTDREPPNGPTVRALNKSALRLGAALPSRHESAR